MKKIVEIQGVKVEVELQEAKVIQQYKIGDAVKVLKREYSSYKVYNGIIADFIPFEKLPTILLAYVEESYSPELKFLEFNTETEGVEISPAVDPSIPIDKKSMVEKLDRQITNKENELLEMKNKKSYFLDRFGKYFKDIK